MIEVGGVPVSLQIDWLKDELERKFPSEPLLPSHFDEGYFEPDLTDRGQRRAIEGGWQFPAAKKIVKVFPGLSVFELGCGVGFTLNRLRELGVKVGGVDISHYAVNRAKNEFGLDVQVCDLRDLGVYPGWELIYIHNVLEYLTLCELEFVLDKIREGFPDMIYFLVRVNCTQVITGFPPSSKGRRLIRSYEWWQWKIRERWFSLDEKDCELKMNDLGPEIGYPVVTVPLRVTGDPRCGIRQVKPQEEPVQQGSSFRDGG